ncbi:protein CASC3 isoform X2 [Latimeria chalumnae]|uniref:protein CASC3 isoform X2 n=1 Tax=Latimeria chalumnae TaxID=7897 RepID=UPI00313E4465
MADRRRRRKRASQDSEEDEESGSGAESPKSAVELAASRARSGSGGGGEEVGGGGNGNGNSNGNSNSASTSTTTTTTTTTTTGGGEGGVRRDDTAGGCSEEDESECESEDGIGEAVLSDYESADENGSQVSEGDDEEGEYSDEEGSKEKTKQTSEGLEVNEPSVKEEGEKSEQKGTVAGERQSGDGQESTESVENKAGKKTQKHLDDDEDRKNPAYIPRKGFFFEHDLRGQTQEEEVRPKGGRQRKLWKDEGRWEHDRFREDEQAPKSREELIALYGYDIRSNNNPDEIQSRRIRKPRFGSPSRREKRWQDEKPNRPPRHQGTNAPPPRTFVNKNSTGSGRTSQSRNFPRTGGYKETRMTYKSLELNSSYTNRTGIENLRAENELRFKKTEQNPMRDPSPIAENRLDRHSPVKREEAVLENQTSSTTDIVLPVQDRPIEKKSYSRARRSRNKVTEVGKQLSTDEPPPAEPLAPVPEKPVQVVSPPPTVKSGSWETPVEPTVSGIEHEMAQMNLTEQTWTPGQPQFIQPRELRGIPNQMHMGGATPQYNRIEDMGVQAGRAKRYSSQRQRPVPEPAPMHIGIMEGHYYDPLQFQGPIYTHSESPTPLPPQSMIVQPEMHLTHPGLHPHQSPAPLTNPGLYASPVSMSPGQPPPPPPPQQLLPPPTYFSPPGVMNFGSPGYPYAPGAIAPHLYPNAQAQSQVYGGVTYYNTVQQQVQPKPSPPRRTSQPVTIKPPPPEDNKIEKSKEKNSA